MRVESIIQPSGEELPLLLDDNDMPIPSANEWLFGRRGFAGSTLVGNARDLGPLFQWLSHNKIDLWERVSSKRGFSEAEITGSLIEELRKDRRKNTKVKSLVVAPSTFNRRLEVTRKFLNWYFSIAIGVSHNDAGLYDRIDANKQRIRAWLSDSRMNPEPTRGGEKDLTSRQEFFLLEALDPNNAGRVSRYQRALRSRNYVIAILSLFCGLRRGELLCLRVEDAITGSSIPQVNVVRRAPDPSDTRKPRPAVKRNARVLHLGVYWAKAVDDYITEWRDVLQERGEKETDYLILSDTGQPMSSSAYNKVFRVIRQRFPDQLPKNLTPHSLRYAFSNNMLQRLRDAGLSEEDAKRQLAVLRGDSSETSQDVYVKQMVARQASHHCLAYQQAYSEVCEDVPF